jgi:hypothetical protein
MAVGFPTKVTYANGDVFSASDINDTNGTINLLGQSVTTSAGKNAIINGGFDVWQRGTSVAVAAAAKTFTADRFWGARGTSVAGATVSRQSVSDTTNLPTIQYCARVQRDSGNTSTQYIALTQDIETSNSIRFAGQSVTLTFYARKGANFSAASNALPVSVVTGTGTDQSLSTGYTGQVTAFSGTATLTTTWQRFTFTGTIAATATEIGIQPYYTPVGTAGANDYFEITGVQLELGSTATTFSRAGGTIQGELLACMRYYYLLVRGNGNYIPFSNGYQFTSTQVTGITPFPVAMRTAPTLDMSGGTDYYLFSRNGANDFWNTCISDGSSTTTGAITVTSNISGTAGQGGAFYSATANTGTGYIAWSAEL